jgi:hypothetical protein
MQYRAFKITMQVFLIKVLKKILFYILSLKNYDKSFIMLTFNYPIKDRVGFLLVTKRVDSTEPISELSNICKKN